MRYFLHYVVESFEIKAFLKEYLVTNQWTNMYVKFPTLCSWNLSHT